MRRPVRAPSARGAVLPAAVLVLGLAGCGDPGGDPGHDGARGAHTGPAAARAADTGEVATPPETGAAPGFPLVVTDAAARRISFSSPPERIVSLVPSVTGILVAVGAGQRLVGRTDHDTLAAVAALPSVGGGLAPAMESLLVLEPDLVIRFAGESDPVTARRLDEAGIPHLAVRPDAISDVLRTIRRLGRVTGEGERARALVAEIESGLDSVRARVAGRRRPEVAFVVGGSPPWVAGPGTFVHELIRVAGGRNAFADLDELYPVVSPEEFVARDIDLLLTPPGAHLDPPLRQIPRLTAPAGLQRPGPDLHRVARELARLLHPEAFP